MLVFALFVAYPQLPEFFVRVLLDQQSTGALPTHAFGCIAGRSREEAILLQLLVGWRLKHAGLLHQKNLHDINNVFGSVSFDNIKELFEPLDNTDYLLFIQHFVNCVFVMNIDGEDTAFKPGTGVFPGGSIAAQVFCYCFWDKLTPWIDHAAEHNPQLVTQFIVCPDEDVYLGMTSFVDDLAAITVDNTIYAPSKGCASGVMLTRCLRHLGVVRNLDKEQSMMITPQGCTPLQAQQFTALLASGDIQRDARYLGPQLNDREAFTTERAIRVAKAERNWKTFYALFVSATPLRFRLLVFRCVYIMTLFSAVISFAFSDFDYRLFNSKIVSKLRVLLKGQACKKHMLSTGEVKYHALSAEAVLRECQVLLAAAELCAQRLRWMQRLLSDRENHHALLTAFFAPRLSFESLSQSVELSNTLHPWAQQLHDDLCMLHRTDAGYDLSQAIGTNITSILHNDEIRNMFCTFDLAEFKASFLSMSVPFPGKLCELPSEDASENVAGRSGVPDSESQFVCKELLQDGRFCGKVFISLSSLKQHVRHDGSGGTHGIPHIVSAVICPQCPICYSKFSSAASARQHIRNSFTTGHCPVDQASRPITSLPQLREITCMFCAYDGFDNVLRDLHSYNVHIRDHLSHWLPMLKCIPCHSSFASRDPFEEHRLVCAAILAQAYTGSSTSSSGPVGRTAPVGSGSGSRRPHHGAATGSDATSLACGPGALGSQPHVAQSSTKEGRGRNRVSAKIKVTAGWSRRSRVKTKGKERQKEGQGGKQRQGVRGSSHFHRTHRFQAGSRYCKRDGHTQKLLSQDGFVPKRQVRSVGRQGQVNHNAILRLYERSGQDRANCARQPTCDIVLQDGPGVSRNSAVQQPYTGDAH